LGWSAEVVAVELAALERWCAYHFLQKGLENQVFARVSIAFLSGLELANFLGVCFECGLLPFVVGLFTQGCVFFQHSCGGKQAVTSWARTDGPAGWPGAARVLKRLCSLAWKTDRGCSTRWVGRWRALSSTSRTCRGRSVSKWRTIMSMSMAGRGCRARGACRRRTIRSASRAVRGCCARGAGRRRTSTSCGGRRCGVRWAGRVMLGSGVPPCMCVPPCMRVPPCVRVPLRQCWIDRRWRQLCGGRGGGCEYAFAIGPGRADPQHHCDEGCAGHG
jgi:hypothetical protein